MGWSPRWGVMVWYQEGSDRQVPGIECSCYRLYSCFNQEGFPKGLLPSKSLGAPGHSVPSLGSSKAMRSLQESSSPALGVQPMPVKSFSSSRQERLQEVKGREHQACTWLLGCCTLGCPWPLTSCNLHPCGPLQSLQGSNPERSCSPQRYPFHPPAQA